MQPFKNMGSLFLWIWCTVICCSALVGQSNSYTVTWLGIPVVDVTVAVEPGDTVLQGLFTAKTRPWFDPIYAVDNRYSVACSTDGNFPLNYTKHINEQDQESSFSTAYHVGTGAVEYSNGLRRIFPRGYHNLLSSLLWVERRDWRAGERLDIRVEIEGTLWQVAIHCREIIAASAGPTAEIEVLFKARVGGEPVLSHTDIVTHKLPAVDRKMVFFVQLDGKLIEAIEFGRPPFLVRAALVSS